MHCAEPIWALTGHGTHVKDENGDEADGMDEAIVPVDFLTGGPEIIDENSSNIIIDDIILEEVC